MLAKINVPKGSEVELVAATVGAAYGDGKEQWDSDSGASFHISHTQVGLIAYKKTLWGQPLKSLMGLYCRKAVEQWGTSLIYYKTKAVLGFPGEKSLVFYFYPRKGSVSATGVRRTPSQGAALRLAEKTAEAMRTAMGQWGPCADVRRSPNQGVALAVAVKAHDMMAVQRVLAHPSEEITQKTVQAMGIATTGQWGPCEARLRVKAKQQAVQWIDGPGKTGNNGVGDEDLHAKPVENESVGKRETPQLDIQELESGQPQDPEEGTQETPPGPVEETREAAIGSRGRDTGSAIGSRGRYAGGTVESRGDTGGAVGSRRRDTEGAVRF